ncbi:MAG: glycosyltransferase, partial [Acidimicrobiia bacterium]
MKICLAMIVRNETRTLPRLVASLDGVIDEWCIIDTGSDDGTPEVVHELLGHLPGRLEHRPWKDFGHNRTELVRLCRTLPGVTHLLLADADMTMSITEDFRTQLGRQSCPMLLVPVRV